MRPTHIQLPLTLTPTPKQSRPKLSPFQKVQKIEHEKAHRLFKLLKSNLLDQFTIEDKLLLKKYYNINL